MAIIPAAAVKTNSPIFRYFIEELRVLRNNQNLVVPRWNNYFDTFECSRHRVECKVKEITATFQQDNKGAQQVQRYA